MTDVEELIRDALRRQESRAPDPGPVLAALRHPARRRSRGRAGGLAIAIAVAVVVIAIPATIYRFVGPLTEPDGPSGGIGGLGAAELPRAGLLRYTASWLPTGFTEVYRAAGPDGRQFRQWAGGTVSADRRRNPSDTPLVTLSVHAPSEVGWTDVPDVLSSATDKVTVRGHPAGFVRLDQAVARLIWMPDTGTILQVSLIKVPDMRQTALRIANSVQPDGGSTVRPGIRFGSLPARLAEQTSGVVGNSPADATTELVAADPGRADAGSPTVRVILSPQAPESGGEPVTVRGRAGTYVAPADRRATEHNDFAEARLAVRLDDGRWLTLYAPGLVTGHGSGAPTPLSRDQLIDILNALVFQTPDYTWVGR